MCLLAFHWVAVIKADWKASWRQNDKNWSGRTFLDREMNKYADWEGCLGHSLSFYILSLCLMFISIYLYIYVSLLNCELMKCLWEKNSIPNSDDFTAKQEKMVGAENKAICSVKVEYLRAFKLVYVIALWFCVTFVLFHMSSSRLHVYIHCLDSPDMHAFDLIMHAATFIIIYLIKLLQSSVAPSLLVLFCCMFLFTRAVMYPWW